MNYEPQAILSTVRERMRGGERAGARALFDEHADALAGLGSEAEVVDGLLTFLEGDRGEGSRKLDPALRPASDTWAGVSDRALGLTLRNRPRVARRLLDRLVAAGAAGAVDYGRLGAARLMSDDLDGAEAAYEEALNREPGRVEWLNNLGATRLRQERFEAALEAYDQALHVDPDHAQASKGRERVLLALDQAETLLTERQQAVAERPASAGARVYLARAHDRLEQPEEMVAAYRAAAALLSRGEAEDGADWDAGEVLLEAGRSLIGRARYGVAIHLIAAAEEAGAEARPVALARARIALATERPDKASEVLDALEEEDAEALPVRLTYAQAQAHAGEYEAAEAALRELVETYPGHPGVRSTLGQTLLWLGRIDEAAEQFEGASRINPAALANLATMDRLPDDEATLARLERLARLPLLAEEARGNLAFGLHKAYDKRGEYDTAFAWLAEANERTGRTVRFDPDAHSRYIDRLIEAWQPATFERLAGYGSESARPVFVVGMPRSGTTLLEQILGAHPAVFPAGELPLIGSIVRRLPEVLGTGRPYPENVADFWSRTVRHAADYYLKHLRELDDAAAHVVDKMPHNFLHLGLIATLFPNATLIHIRRDPRDTALSNYQQNFKMKHGMLGYSTRLDWTARQINDYHRLMEHWRKVLPVELVEVDYEALVADRDAVTAELLATIGVDWSDQVRDFHRADSAVRTASVTQVRQGIYTTSSQKWRRYEAYLGPLLANLDPAVTAPYDRAHAAREAPS